MPDHELLLLIAGVFLFLTIFTAIGAILNVSASAAMRKKELPNLLARIRAWWVICIFVVLPLLAGKATVLVLFGLVSFLALREYAAILPYRRSDHRALFWSFFIIMPLNYIFLAMNWYGFFIIFIPVYAFIFIPVRLVLAGDPIKFLERCAKIQWGLMVCVYLISHAPALLMLTIPGYSHQNAKLLLYLLIIVQISDVFQFVFGKLFGRHKIVPRISPGKTWAGFAGGVLTASMVGTLLYWVTPFSPLQAAAMSLIATVFGFFGDVTMSALKRDFGIKDFGALIEGHGGILDRIDSLLFAAPIFFHLTRFYFT